MNPRVLIADDEDGLRWVLEKGLRQAGYDVTSVKDGPGAIQAFEAEPFDIVLLDVRMPGVDGLAVLARLREVRPDATVVVMTAHGTMDTAIQAMQRGAYDYLAKPFDLDEVVLLAERALAARRLTQEVRQLKSGLQEVWEFGALIGRHPRMQEVYKTIGRIASSDVTVLLRGESGTGKELVARAIHHYSRRAGRPFVAVSCAAIPATLLESEMFGHERGAFTDAKERRLGRLELAHGGTLYLDEIGDMPVELQNVSQRALVMATSGVILPEHLPIGPVSAASSMAADATLEEIIEQKLTECVRGLREHASATLYDLMLGLVEKPLLRAVLRETGGNQVRAAQILGINRNTLRKKLIEHGIDPGGLEG